MKKSVAITNLNTKIKTKIGLINKLEHGSVHEDMINEVYTDPIIDTDVTATHTTINDAVNNGYRIILKKVGNVVYFNGQINKKTSASFLEFPFININNLEFQNLTGNEFFFNAFNNNGTQPVLASVFNNTIRFFDLPNTVIYFNGTYLTNNN